MKRGRSEGEGDDACCCVRERASCLLAFPSPHPPHSSCYLLSFLTLALPSCPPSSSLLFSRNRYSEFEAMTVRDVERGSLYGLEKFWAFHHYSGIPKDLNVEVNPKVSSTSGERGAGAGRSRGG
jgi:hypothetical protein